MVIKEEVAYGIVNSIADLRKGDDLEDFTVIVDDTRVRCHSFILAACSHFFRGLLRSGMKESNENCATLKEVSHPTFTLILTALYTGVDVLTSENVINIWHAANLLQIDFLIKECEHFVIDDLSLDNYGEVYQHAKMLDSREVSVVLHEFMLMNFDILMKSQSLLGLSFSDLLALVESDDLGVTTEDDVIEAILKWVSHVPKNICSDEGNQMDSDDPEINNVSERSTRKEKTKRRGSKKLSSFRGNIQEHTEVLPAEERDKNLFELISAARLCLASSNSVETLLRHPMIMGNEETRNLVVDAVCYQLQIGRRHGQWPGAAVHRRGSDLENVMVWSGSTVEVFSFADFQDYKLDGSPEPYSVITSFDNKPYLITAHNLYVYERGIWTTILRGPGYQPIAVPCEKCIYLFSKTSGEAHKVSPVEEPLELHRIASVPGERSITLASSFKEKILAFNIEVIDGEDLTGVHCFDTTTETWQKLDNIEGPAENLISFHNGKDSYLLQTNGNMWTVTKSETKAVEINFFNKIWDFKLDLCGAVFFKDTLFIFCVLKDKHTNKPSAIPGVARDVQYVSFTQTAELSLAPVIMPKIYFFLNK